MSSLQLEHTLRVVVCDDDPIVRGVVGDLVGELGGEVMAETDTASDTIVLAQRFEPDVVILDLNLRHGSGAEVLEALLRTPDGPRVVVFTAYDALAPIPGDRVDVVHKPDFEGVARCLAALDERPAQERRRPVRTLPGPARAEIDDAAAFYRTLNEAQPGDVIVSIPTDGVDPAELVAGLRRTVRAQDRVHPRSDDVLLLLIGGGESAVGALQDRLVAQVPDIADRIRAADVGDDPSGAFSQIT